LTVVSVAISFTPSVPR